MPSLLVRSLNNVDTFAVDVSLPKMRQRLGQNLVSVPRINALKALIAILEDAESGKLRDSSWITFVESIPEFDGIGILSRWEKSMNELLSPEEQKIVLQRIPRTPFQLESLKETCIAREK